MNKDELTRRDVLSRLCTIAAAATGLSVAEVESLFADVTKPQVKKKPAKKKATPEVSPKTVSKTQEAALAKKTADKNLKALKVLLENSKQVFENEYGRVTPVVQKPAKNFFDKGKLPNDMVGGYFDVCPANIGLGGGVTGKVDLGICQGVNICNGQKLTGPDDPCEGTNTCNGQNCTGMVECDDNSCQGQKCSTHVTCGKNTQTLVTVDLLNQFKTDPYVQALFTEFEVNNAAALLTKIKARLGTFARPF
jgi:hypothetical protein